MPACFITNNSTTLCSQSTIKMPSLPDQHSVLLNTTTSPVSPPNLTNNNNSNLNSSALRRSLSAVDMSLSNSSSSIPLHPSMKKTASYDHLNELNHQESSSYSSPPVVSKGAFDDIWKSINQNGKTNSLPPYIHPLLKRWSTSSLSDKSLEICTESLGSETGSDILSSKFSVSDDLHVGCVDGSSSAEGEEVVETKVPAEDEEEEEEEELVLLPVEMMMMKKEEVVVQAAFVEDDMKKNVVGVDQPKLVPPPLPSLANRGTSYTTKKVGGGQRSFPPPLPSLANRGMNGSNLHVTMRSHRQDGRLVLEAISVSSPNCCFHAQRLDGRLLLTFSDDDEHLITDTAAGGGNDDHCQQLCKLNGVFSDENENQICCENELEDDDDGENYVDRNKLVSIMPPQNDDNHHQSEVSGKIQNTHRGLINYRGHKFMGLTKTPSGQHSQSHRQKLNKAVNDNTTTVKDEVAKPPLPPRPPSATSRLIPTATSAAAAPFNYNAYEYYWRRTASPTTTTTTIHSTYLDTTPAVTTTGAGGGKRVPPPTLSPKTVRGINDMFVELAAAQQQAHRNYNNTKFMLVKPTTDILPTATATAALETVKNQLSSSPDYCTKVFTEPPQKPADHDQFMNHRHPHHHQLPPLPPPFVTGCRLSLLMWEPHCIATS